MTPTSRSCAIRSSSGRQGSLPSGMEMDYPSIENFLTRCTTRAPVPTMGLQQSEFDARLKEAAAAPSLDEANKLYQDAEDILGEDLAVIPMWSYQTGIGRVRSCQRCQVTRSGPLT